MGRRGTSPDYDTREAFVRLIAEGVPSAPACRPVGVNPPTGKRWRERQAARIRRPCAGLGARDRHPWGVRVKSQRVCNSASSSRPIRELASKSGWPTSSIGTSASMSPMVSGRK